MFMAGVRPTVERVTFQGRSWQFVWLWPAVWWLILPFQIHWSVAIVSRRP